MFSFNSTYPLRKSRLILRTACETYTKKGLYNPALEEKLKALDEACLANDKTAASSLAKEVDMRMKDDFKKSWGELAKEFVFAIIFALIIATLIRQTWFELYEIPTGSMRPTFKEQDDLIVSKTAFGLNIPTQTGHFVFEPENVQRSSIIIWSGDNMPIPDVDSKYFWVFPYKKRYVKRLMAKPGDSVYFYGGKVYALDSEGQLDQDLLKAPWMEKLEYIPFLSFEGEATSPNPQEIVFNFFAKPFGRLKGSSIGQPKGEIFTNGEWKEDTSLEYGKTYGIDNFAMARLIEAPKNSTDGIMYLELRHHPSLVPSKAQFQNRVTLGTDTSLIPLSQGQLEKLAANLYTARFEVKNGKAKTYSIKSMPFDAQSPTLTGVPDGTYEFYYGKAYQIGFWGISKELPLDHPLYNKDPKFIQKLFNLGREWNNLFNSNKVGIYPHRYAYYRNGDLYVMGAPLLEKEDPTLQRFVDSEKKKAHPFIDQGEPSTETILKYGLKMPAKSYLALGDNHAMSGDSRIYGFVPEENLQGVPELIIWPPGDRFGNPPQKPYPWISTSRLIVWSIAFVIAVLYWLYVRKRNRTPQFKSNLHPK